MLPNKFTLWFDVTDKDIETGFLAYENVEIAYTHSCAIAQACNRQYPLFDNARVFGGVGFEFEGKTFLGFLPETGTRLLMAFDERDADKLASLPRQFPVLFEIYEGD